MKFTISKELVKKMTEVAKFVMSGPRFSEELSAIQIKAYDDSVHLIAFNGSAFYISIVESEVESTGEFSMAAKTAPQIFKQFVDGTVEVKNNTKILFKHQSKSMQLALVHNIFKDVEFITAQHEISLPFDVFRRGMQMVLSTTMVDKGENRAIDFDSVTIKVTPNEIGFVSMDKVRGTVFRYKQQNNFNYACVVPASSILSKITNNKSYKPEDTVVIRFGNTATQFSIGNDTIKTLNKTGEVLDIENKILSVVLAEGDQDKKLYFAKEDFSDMLKDVDLVFSDNNLQQYRGLHFKKHEDYVGYKAQTPLMATAGKLKLLQPNPDYSDEGINEWIVSPNYIKNAISFIRDEFILYYSGPKMPLVLENFINEEEIAYMIILPMQLNG